MKSIPIIATIATLSIATSAAAQLIKTAPENNLPSNLPKIKLIRNGTKLRVYDDNIIQTIAANSLKVRVLESLTCEGKQVKRQTLSGKKFVPQAVKLDKQTGNLAVGVLLQDCIEKNISAVFILQPQPNWRNYVVHRVPVPGKSQLKSRFSTYPLGKIKLIGFIDGDLLIKHVDSTNSEALLVYSSSNKPVGKYAGCVVTKQSSSNSICPMGNW